LYRSKNYNFNKFVVLNYKKQFMKEEYNVKDLVNEVFNIIEEKKGNNIVIIKFTPEITTLCDYFIIADAESDRQLKAIAESIRRTIKTKFHVNPVHIEGMDNSQWIVLDYLDIIVHLFASEMREFYSLEQLWADAKQYNKPIK